MAFPDDNAFGNRQPFREVGPVGPEIEDVHVFGVDGDTVFHEADVASSGMVDS